MAVISPLKVQIFIALCLFIQVSFGNVASITKLRKANKKPKLAPPRPQVIGGEVASSGQFPWQIMMMLNGEFQCGGSLISSEWVLTAAHCLEDPGNYSIRLGGLNKAPFEAGRIQMDIPSANIILHESYDKVTIANDIAVMMLPFPVTLPSKSSKSAITYDKIALPGSKEKIAVGTNAVASGWGRNNPDDVDEYSFELNFVDQKVISNEDCKKDFSKLKDSNICVDLDDEVGTCSGDSGGPLVMQVKGKNVLIGINSFGTEACSVGSDAFTRVTSYLPWIKSKTGVK